MSGAFLQQTTDLKVQMVCKLCPYKQFFLSPSPFKICNASLYWEQSLAYLKHNVECVSFLRSFVSSSYLQYIWTCIERLIKPKEYSVINSVCGPDALLLMLLRDFSLWIWTGNMKRPYGSKDNLHSTFYQQILQRTLQITYCTGRISLRTETQISLG